MRQILLGAMLYGIPYAAVVGIAYFLLRVLWRTRFQSRGEDVALAIPILVYILLDHFDDRQGLYFYRAILITIAAVCGALPIKGAIPRHRITAIATVVITGSLAAVLSWRYLAKSRDMFENAPGVW